MLLFKSVDGFNVALIPFPFITIHPRTGTHALRNSDIGPFKASPPSIIYSTWHPEPRSNTPFDPPERGLRFGLLSGLLSFRDQEGGRSKGFALVGG